MRHVFKFCMKFQEISSDFYQYLWNSCSSWSMSAFYLGWNFSTLLLGDGDINSATREDIEPVPIDDDGVDLPPRSLNEVRVPIQRIKNNKAAGPDVLPAELIKAGSDELVHQLIWRIWLEACSTSEALVFGILSWKRKTPRYGQF